MTVVKRFISQNGFVRISSVQSTELVRATLPKGNISPLVATLMGRAITAVVLMVSHLKEKQRIGLHFRGDGPVKEIFAEATREGHVRAFSANPEANLPGTGSAEVEAFGLGAGLGAGTLEVAISQPFQEQPHRGLTSLRSGEIGDDIAEYFHQSQQVPTIVALSAMPDDQGCAWAGGYLIELMPGYDEDTVAVLEAIAETVPTPGPQLDAGCGAEALVSAFVSALDCTALADDTVYEAHCNCSKKRILNSFSSLGPAQLQEMVEEGKTFEVTCHFCGKDWAVAPMEIKRVLRQIQLH